MALRVALIHNPGARGSRSPDAWQSLLEATGLQVVASHELRGDLKEAVRAGRPDRLVVVGGDGSLGPAFAAARAAELPLAIVPAGTANDFARTLGIPLDIGRAVALAGARGAVARPVWGATIDGRPFVNTASVGLAAAAAGHAGPLKARLGSLAYPVGAALAATRDGPITCKLAIGGEVVASGSVWQLLVGASGVFGAVAALGTASPDDPRLATAWIPAGNRWTLPLRAAGLLTRTVEDQASVRSWLGTRVEVTTNSEAWNVDGDVVNDLPSSVELRPAGPVEILVPGR